EPKPHGADPQGLPEARPDRVEPATPNLLPGNPFSLTSGSAVVTVTEPNHGRSTSDTVVFRNVDGSPGGLAFTVFENSSGFSITKVDANSYTFDCGSGAALTEKAGGMTVTAGPVTQSA
ncbi:MAG: hypothetical protein ACPGRW_09590, partial [Flavobacteriaceae bacterium]